MNDYARVASVFAGAVEINDVELSSARVITRAPGRCRRCAPRLDDLKLTLIGAFVLSFKMVPTVTLDTARTNVRAAEERNSSLPRFAVRAVFDVPYNEDAATFHHKQKLDVYLPVLSHGTHNGSVTKGANGVPPQYNSDSGSDDAAASSVLLVVADHGANSSDDHVISVGPQSQPAVGTSAAGPPVIVFIHGGGWKKGGRRTLGGMHGNVGRAFASRGFVVAVISYRLSSVKLRHMIVVYAVASLVIGLILTLSLNLQDTTSLKQPNDILQRNGSIAACFLVPFVVGFSSQFVWWRSGGPKVKHPDHVDDAAMAVAWVHKHIGADARFACGILSSSDAHAASSASATTAQASLATPGRSSTERLIFGDRTNMCIVGHSAGGHIAAMLALQPERLVRAFQQADATAQTSTPSSAGAMTDQQLCSLAQADVAAHIRAFVCMSGVYDAKLLENKMGDGDDDDQRLPSPIADDSSNNNSSNTSVRWWHQITSIPTVVFRRISTTFRRVMYLYPVFGDNESKWEGGFPVGVLRQAKKRREREKMGKPEQQNRHHHAASAIAVADSSPSVKDIDYRPPMLFINAQHDWTLETHTDVLIPALLEAGWAPAAASNAACATRDVTDYGATASTADPSASIASYPSYLPPRPSGSSLSPSDNHRGIETGTAASSPTTMLSCHPPPRLARINLLNIDHVGYILGMGHRHTAGNEIVVPAVMAWLAGWMGGAGGGIQQQQQQNRCGNAEG